MTDSTDGIGGKSVTWITECIVTRSAVVIGDAVDYLEDTRLKGLDQPTVERALRLRRRSGGTVERRWWSAVKQCVFQKLHSSITPAATMPSTATDHVLHGLPGYIDCNRAVGHRMS